jgi:cytochrome c oxidase cbb3-type subunit IV
MTMDMKTIHEMLATLWTVWAVTICLGIAFWALRPANRERFENDAHIPLNDER